MEVERKAAAALCEVYDRALKVLAEAEPVLWGLPDHPDRKAFILAHAGVSTSILSKLRAPLVIQYPELNPEPVLGPPDTEMDEEELQVVALISKDQVAWIDAALLADCVPAWRKVARIVGTVLTQAPPDLAEVPVGYLVQRVKALVDGGQLESEGDLDYARHSEVRLPRALPAR